MNHEEQQQQYALDELLHPEGKPWEWWERKATSEWVSMLQEPSWCEDINYRRKSAAPNWDEELSPKEVAECDEWPDGYYLDGEYIRLKSTTVGDWYVWDQGDFHEETNTGIKELIGTKRTLLNHFKKRRKAALATYGNTKDNPSSKLQQQYALDELLLDTPWEYWEVAVMKNDWVPMSSGFVSFGEDINYRRKSTAPNWDEELSPKEVAECDEWPEGYKMGSFGGHLIIDYHNCEEPYTVWNQHIGFVYDLHHQQTLLNHFKKRRKAALATYGNTKDNPLSKRQQQAAEDLQEVTKRDHKPSKDEILRDEAIARFTEKATSKFNAGIQEHNPNGGNDLEDRATFADLEDEIIDLWYYVQGLKRRIHKT
jgi:hypothetical protein